MLQGVLGTNHEWEKNNTLLIVFFSHLLFIFLHVLYNVPNTFAQLYIRIIYKLTNIHICGVHDQFFLMGMQIQDSLETMK